MDLFDEEYSLKDRSYVLKKGQTEMEFVCNNCDHLFTSGIAHAKSLCRVCNTHAQGKEFVRDYGKPMAAVPIDVMEACYVLCHPDKHNLSSVSVKVWEVLKKLKSKNWKG